jgi:hypothetical protein
VPEAHVEILSLSPEAEELAAAYIEDGAGKMRSSWGQRLSATHNEALTVSLR